MSITVKVNGSLETALKIFKRKCEKEGILSDFKRKAYFERPGLVRRKKHINALKRAKRLGR